jgi:dihydroorotate dehydrogenase electron transfer subunit
MAEQIKELVGVVGQEEIAPGVFSMWVESARIAKSAAPGQFLSVFCRDGSRLLPRPISVCETDQEKGLVRIVYRVVGEGTREFAAYHSGVSVAVLGPLGNGFSSRTGKALLVGGGIGIPPLLELAKRLKCEKQIVLGYRSDLFLQEDMAKVGKVFVATEDGSTGTKGTVLDAIREHHLDAEVMYACGPIPMLRALKKFAGQTGMEAQISLEERMACGIGACLGCVVRSAEVDEHTHVRNKRVCKDGPVFDAREVEL